MHLFGSTFICVIIAAFVTKIAVGTFENQTIVVTFYFKNGENCRLAHVALATDKNIFPVVELKDMLPQRHLEEIKMEPTDTCAYESVVAETEKMMFLIFTSHNETVLRGFAKIDKQVYKIENQALEFNENGLLVLVQNATFYQIYNNQLELLESHIRRFRRTLLTTNTSPLRFSYNNADLPIFYLELVIATDKVFCQKFCDVTDVDENCRNDCDDHAIKIANYVHSHFRKFNLYVVLVGTYYQDLGNPQPLENSVNGYASVFKSRITANVAEPYDVVHLLSGIDDVDGTIGVYADSTVCAKEHAISLSLGAASTDAAKRSIVATNMIARHLNIREDTDGCTCDVSTCIMAIERDGSNIPLESSWSSCSIEKFKDVSETGVVYCLRDKPQISTTLHDGLCGNGIVDANEQCDNGLLQSDNCCDSTTCQRIGNVECASGACCDLSTCTFKRRNTICSIKKNECDKPEYCSGSSEQCPEDLFMPNGLECDTTQGTCQNGQCRSRDLACKMIYGENAASALDSCYLQNADSNYQTGFCNINLETSTVTHCATGNKLCGLLHCRTDNMDNLIWPIPRFTYSRVNIETGTAQCRKSYFEITDNLRNPFLVPDGAVCQSNRICIDSVCQTSEIISRSSIPEPEPVNEDASSTSSNVQPELEDGDISSTSSAVQPELQDDDISSTSSIVQTQFANDDTSDVSVSNQADFINNSILSISPFELKPKVLTVVEFATAQTNGNKIKILNFKLIIGLLLINLQCAFLR